MRDCIAVMETMFRDLAEGRILQPLRSLMWLPDHSGLLGMMPGYAKVPNIIGIKLITIFHANGPAGLPSHQGLVILFEATHGQPLLLLDAAELTAIRTAAASALATRLLAREDADTLAIIGAGEQAERHIESISLVRKINAIYLWGRNPDHALALKNRLAARYPIRICNSAREAVEAADIICTVTAAVHPVVEGHWLKPGAHLNVVGASRIAAAEIDTAAVAKSRFFVDFRGSAEHEAGELRRAIDAGVVTKAHVLGEIGEVANGTVAGRTSAGEITVFKSLGVSAEDLAAAHFVLQRAEAQGVGQVVDL